MFKILADASFKLLSSFFPFFFKVGTFPLCSHCSRHQGLAKAFGVEKQKYLRVSEIKSTKKSIPKDYVCSPFALRDSAYLFSFDQGLQLVGSVVQFAEGVDLLLVFRGHLLRRHLQQQQHRSGSLIAVSHRSVQRAFINANSYASPDLAMHTIVSSAVGQFTCHSKSALRDPTRPCIVPVSGSSSQGM